MLKPILGMTAVIVVGCAPTLQRSVPNAPLFDVATQTLWIVELDQRTKHDDRLLVTVCHREATPACVRMPPKDLRNYGDYENWLQSLPPEVRRLATLPYYSHTNSDSAGAERPVNSTAPVP